MDIPSTQCFARRNSGFSLAELLLILAILGILAGIAIPAAGTLLHSTRLSNQVNLFAGQLNYARSAAIKNGYRVQVCKSLDNSSCNNSGDWHEGWITFLDKNSDRQRNPGETVLQTRSDGNDSVTINYGAFPTDNYVIYYPSGRSLGNGTFTFCDSRSDTEPRALVLYKTGRLRSADIMPDGTPLTCP